MRAADIPQISKLSIPEKILLIEDIWDEIVSEESMIPVPQMHMKELDKRLANHKLRPGALLSLDELQSRITERK
jgi:putative addiction module component (TIGR02574 family)